MKSKILLKEKTVHGTTLIPIAIHHLNYAKGLENFFYLHWHHEFEFIIVLEGAITYTVENKDHPIMAGEGFFINSNELHAAKSYNGMSCSACAILFHPNLFGDNNQGSTYSKFVYPILNNEIEFENHLTYKRKWMERIINLLKEIDALRLQNLSASELLLKSRIFEIWHLCYENSKTSAPNSGRDKNYKIKRMQPVLDYIHANYKYEISLPNLAKIIPMSEGQFCHSFKEIMNMPPIAYVVRYRILQSCTLLRETDLKISDIAKNVGFNNISYFNREFIKAIGCAPGMYRKEDS